MVVNAYVIEAKAVVTVNAADHVYSPGALVVCNGEITYVGLLETAPKTMDIPVIRRPEHILVPGFVNTHTHTPMTLFRGLADHAPLGEWFSGPIYRIESATNEEDYALASVLGFRELLRFGSTCVADRGSSFAGMLAAAKDTGIRAVLSRSLRDHGDTTEGKRQLEATIKEIADAGRPDRITFGIGPHATDTCSDALLRECSRTAVSMGVPLFLHAAQSQEEVAACRARGAMGSVDLLRMLGALEPQTVMAHCIYVSPDELRMISEAGAWVAHCPKSNARIEARTFPAKKFIQMGGNVALGTDAAACNNVMDLFEEMRFAAILQKVMTGDPTAFAPLKLLRMATIDGARALGLESQIGSLEAGKRADFLTLHTACHLEPWNNLFSNLVYCASGGDVWDVAVDGEFLIKQGRFTRGEIPEDTMRRIWAAASRIKRTLPQDYS